jgi:hypothetical protein
VEPGRGVVDEGGLPKNVYLMPLHEIEELILGPVDGQPLAMSL